MPGKFEKLSREIGWAPRSARPYPTLSQVKRASMRQIILWYRFLVPKTGEVNQDVEELINALYVAAKHGVNHAR